MGAIVVRAPTRIDFGGGWTDVPPYPEEQGGCVCSVAIARYARARVAPLPGAVRVRDGAHSACARTADELTAGAAAELATGGALALAAAALRRAQAREVSVELASDFPAGAGLGGSSAAGVALAAALAAWRGERPTRAALAERSRATEVEELGVAGGRQDHYAAAFGGALALHFSAAPVAVRVLPLSPAVCSAVAQRCIVAYTGVSRLSGETITAVLQAYRSGEGRVTSALARMAALAGEMAVALAAGDLDALGALVGEHWVHQRSLHPGITTPVIEATLGAARRAGALGGKALGASGGGCVVVIAPAERAAAVRAAVAQVAHPLDFTVDTAGVQVEQGNGAPGWAAGAPGSFDGAPGSFDGAPRGQDAGGAPWRS